MAIAGAMSPHVASFPKRMIFLISLIIAMPLLATDLYLPSLHSIQIELNTTPELAQLTLSIYFITIALMQLIYGPISDRFGRKPVLQLGIGICAIGSLGGALATSIEMLITFRVIQALGAGCGMVIGFTLIQDLCKAHSAKVNGQIIGWVSLSPIAAPLFGGVIETYASWRAAFTILFVLCISLSVLSHFILEEPLKRDKRNRTDSVLSRYQSILSCKEFLKNTLICACHFSIFFTFITIAPLLYISHLGYSPKLFSVMLSLSAMGYITGAKICSTYVARWGRAKACLIGNRIILMGTCGLGLSSLLIPKSGIAITLCVYVIEIGISCAISAGMSLAVAQIKHNMGTAISLIQFSRLFLAGLISGLIVLFENNTALPLTGFALIMTIIAACCLNFIKK